MKLIFFKDKILPTIFIMLSLCLCCRLVDVIEQIRFASLNKSGISVKTSFINEAFASEHKSSHQKEGASPSHHKKDGEKAEEMPSPPGLTANKNPHGIDRAYRNNTEASQGGAYTREEVELLQSLSKRKTEILKSQEEIELKAKILEANELQMTQKLEELKALKNQLEDLMAQYNEKENMKIASLVKIYENMKPKDAAKIFEELDMPILLQVVNTMKEAKVAPILSAMDPIKAKEISTEFANQKKLVSQ